MTDMQRDAVNNLRYGGGLGLARSGRFVPPHLSPAELAEQKVFTRNDNRREALGHTLALGRRYDSAEAAIADARVIADWIGLDIE